jgi:dTDP-4-dehydrorhamnose reductase
MEQRYLVTGATGYVGESLLRSLPVQVPGCTVVGLGLSRELSGARIVRLDLRDAGAIQKLLREFRPTAVFHCAATTDVADCERDPLAARGHIVEATRHLLDGLAAEAPGAAVAALSTDVVFDGERGMYREEDEARPLSVYGRLKLESERLVLEHPPGLVLRASLIYGRRGTHKGTFLAWMIDTLAGGRPLTLFEDEIRTPVFVEDLCGAMIAMVRGRQSGLWHAGGPERLSRVDMGRAVCRALGFDEGLIRAVKLADFHYPAPRPRDVSLDSSRLWSLLGWRPHRFAEVLQAMAKIRA